MLVSGLFLLAGKKPIIISGYTDRIQNHWTLSERRIIISGLFQKYRNIPAILFALVNIAILVGTLLPSDKIARADIFDYDKAIHFLMFLVWTFLFGLVRAIQKKSSPALWAVFLWGSGYGLVIELLQLLLPTNRSPEFFDVVANTLGSLVAVFLLRPLLRRWYSGEKKA